MMMTMVMIGMKRMIDGGNDSDGQADRNVMGYGRPHLQNNFLLWLSGTLAQWVMSTLSR